MRFYFSVHKKILWLKWYYFVTNKKGWGELIQYFEVGDLKLLFYSWTLQKRPTIHISELNPSILLSSFLKSPSIFNILHYKHQNNIYSTHGQPTCYKTWVKAQQQWRRYNNIPPAHILSSLLLFTMKFSIVCRNNTLSGLEAAAIKS